ncbi:MAG: ATP-binding protein [Deltaproteobacteria bacterium]
MGSRSDETRLARLAGVHTYVCDAADVVTIDAEASATLGHPAANPKKLDDLLVLIHAADRRAFEAAVRAARAGGPPKPHTVRVRGSDGALRFVRHVVERTEDGVFGTLQKVDDVVSGTAHLTQTSGGGLELSALLDAAPLPIFMKDVEGHFTFVNRAFRQAVEQVTGEPQDVVGRTQHDFDPNHARRVDARDAEVLNANAVQTYEEHFSSPEGRLVYQLSLFPVHADDGRIVGLGGMSTDITGLRRAEGTVRELDQTVGKWAEAFRVAGIGLAVAPGEKGLLLDVNTAFVRKFRTTTDALIGRSLESLFHPSAVEAARDAMTRAETSGHERFETTMVRGDGDVFAALFDVTLTWTTQGEARRFVTVLDINELRDRENALRIYREIFDHLPFGVLVGRIEDRSDLSTLHFVDGNRFAVDRWEGRGGVLDRPIVETAPGFLETDLPQMYLDAIEKAEMQRVSAYPFGESGELFDIRAARVDDDLVAIIYDEVSERERNLAELERLNDELERSNSELGDFAAVASHDLKAPLRSILSFAGLLREELGEGVSEDAEMHLGFIESSAERLRRLVTDLLDYARVGRRGSELEEVNLAQILAQVQTDLAHTIAETEANVVVSSLPVVVGDAAMLRQLLQNLVANAIKFRGASAPLVEVSSTVHADAWGVSVKDNGIGVPASQHERIFEAFRRLHSEREYPGTGIGLAVCKRIVDRHGGRIWVESEVGQGTHVHFTLAKRVLEERT